MRVLILGGGAAGMAAAVEAAERGAQATVLERMDRVGKKLLATGNGRCNLMNRGEERYPGGAEFAREVLARCKDYFLCLAQPEPAFLGEVISITGDGNLTNG